jgi:non-heme chloroperoxidase
MDTLAQPVAPGLVETMVQESLRVPAHVWRESFAGLLRDDFRDELARIAAPTLLVRGEHDAFVPESDTQQLQRSIARSQLASYAGAGHAMHWEQPERFARDLVRFVEALPG